MHTIQHTCIHYAPLSLAMSRETYPVIEFCRSTTAATTILLQGRSFYKSVPFLSSLVIVCIPTLPLPQDGLCSCCFYMKLVSEFTWTICIRTAIDLSLTDVRTNLCMSYMYACVPTASIDLEGIGSCHCFLHIVLKAHASEWIIL